MISEIYLFQFMCVVILLWLGFQTRKETVSKTVNNKLELSDAMKVPKIDVNVTMGETEASVLSNDHQTVPIEEEINSRTGKKKKNKRDKNSSIKKKKKKSNINLLTGDNMSSGKHDKEVKEQHSDNIVERFQLEHTHVDNGNEMFNMDTNNKSVTSL